MDTCSKPYMQLKN